MVPVLEPIKSILSERVWVEVLRSVPEDGPEDRLY
jgi:hypothetical protein